MKNILRSSLHQIKIKELNKIRKHTKNIIIMNFKGQHFNKSLLMWFLIIYLKEI